MDLNIQKGYPKRVLCGVFKTWVCTSRGTDYAREQELHAHAERVTTPRLLASSRNNDDDNNINNNDEATHNSSGAISIVIRSLLRVYLVCDGMGM